MKARVNSVLHELLIYSLQKSPFELYPRKCKPTLKEEVHHYWWISIIYNLKVYSY